MRVLLICSNGFALSEIANFFITKYKKRDLEVFAISINENFKFDEKTNDQLKHFQNNELKKLNVETVSTFDLGFALTKEANDLLLKMNNVALKFNYNFDFSKTNFNEITAIMELYFMRFSKVYFGEI